MGGMIVSHDGSFFVFFRMKGDLEICYRKRCAPDSEIDDDNVVGFAIRVSSLRQLVAQLIKGKAE